MIIQVTDQEFHTILAALRFYQEKGQGDPLNRSDRIHDIATNLEDVTSLDTKGIDQAVENLNFQGVQVWVFAMENKHGVSFFASEKYEVGLREVYDEISTRWPEDLEKSSDVDQAVSDFFEYEPDESMIVELVEVTQ